MKTDGFRALQSGLLPATCYNVSIIPVWLRNRLISAGLELVLSHTLKSCITSNYRQFSTNIKLKIIKSMPVLAARAFGSLGLTRLALIL